jgi:DnaJ-class molecular chaperone
MQQTKKNIGTLSHYQILDVPREATFDEIKKSFYKKIKEIHPDKAVQFFLIIFIT